MADMNEPPNESQQDNTSNSDRVTPKKRRKRVSSEPLTPEEHAEAQQTFLAEYARRGNVTDACKRASISRTTVYRWQEHDEAFSLQFNQAKEAYCDSLRHEITRRARDGVLKPVYQGGKKVGQIREYSDTLLIFEAKKHMPEYRDKVDVSATLLQGTSSHDDTTASPEAALYATLFVGALNPGDTGGEDDASGPRIRRE